MRLAGGPTIQIHARDPPPTRLPERLSSHTTNETRMEVDIGESDKVLKIDSGIFCRQMRRQYARK
jgi:hypothetical protein